MTILLVHGKPRSGKTFLIFLLSYLRACKGHVVLSNFEIKHENCSQIVPYDLIKILDGGKVSYRRLFCLQEIYGWFNSYRGLSDVSVAEASVIFQSGKLGIDVFGDSQLIGRVDSCLKDMCDRRFEAVSVRGCNRDDKCLGEGCKWFKSCCFKYFELDLRFRDRLVRLDKAPYVVNFKVASRYWDLYDTWSVSKPVGWDDLVVKMEKVDTSLVRDRVNAQVDLLLKNRDKWSKALKPNVEFALLQLGEPTVFSSLVAVGLQLRLGK